MGKSRDQESWGGPQLVLMLVGLREAAGIARPLPSQASYSYDTNPLLPLAPCPSALNALTLLAHLPSSFPSVSVDHHTGALSVQQRAHVRMLKSCKAVSEALRMDSLV